MLQCAVDFVEWKLFELTAEGARVFRIDKKQGILDDSLIFRGRLYKWIFNNGFLLNFLKICTNFAKN